MARLMQIFILLIFAVYIIHLGFEERIKGSHHVFRKSGVEEKINL